MVDNIAGEVHLLFMSDILQNQHRTPAKTHCKTSSTGLTRACRAVLDHRDPVFSLGSSGRDGHCFSVYITTVMPASCFNEQLYFGFCTCVTLEDHHTSAKW